MNWSQRLKISFKVGLILFAVTAGNNIKAQDPDTITAIEIRGISKVSRETVLFRSGLKVGDELRTDRKSVV